MSDVTESFRKEHHLMLPQIEKLRVVADCVGEFSRDHLHRSIDEIYDFLAHSLIPHAAADEAVLYPAVGKALGTPQATTPMSWDHVEVSRLTEQLRILRSRIFQPDFDRVTAMELRRVLYGLYSVVKLHFAKEEEIYLPILANHLSEGDAHELFHKIADVAHHEAHHLLH
ncbi:MAG: hemerythrin domain-containing protein [Candidatus Binatia bacterium]